MTLVLGYNFQDKGTIKTAAMCYDILEAQLKYIAYTTFSSRKRIIEEVCTWIDSILIKKKKTK